MIADGRTIHFSMKQTIILFLSALLTPSHGQSPLAKTTVPYGDHARQAMDIYAQPKSKNLPVVFWIHGGGWESGDKADVGIKPQWFIDRGCVFVSTNYRLLPEVDMGTLIRDVAKSFSWVWQHIAEHGGDPNRVLIGGHSAGAQLAAILCTDQRYLIAEGVPFEVLKGCIPVDGDTYDIPAMIETAETRLRVHGFPPPKNGHRIKFGITPENHKDFSAITHIAKDKGIPPFLILHVADHPDTSIQAQRLEAVLKAAEISVTCFGASDTSHSKLNDNLGRPDDPATAALAKFVDTLLK